MPTSRITTQRQAVYGVVNGQHDHVTADQVFQSVRKSQPRVSLATVYRNLEKLTEDGVINRTSINGVYYFETEQKHHYHAVCLSCGRITNLDSDPASDIEQHFDRQTDYKLTGHDLILYGLCPICLRKR